MPQFDGQPKTSEKDSVNTDTSQSSDPSTSRTSKVDQIAVDKPVQPQSQGSPFLGHTNLQEEVSH